MADVHKSPEPRTVTVDMIPATDELIVDSDTQNKELEKEVTNAPVTPDTEDKLPESKDSKEDVSTQPEGNVEDLKRKSEEMDVTLLGEGTEKKLRLDSPIPEETQDERAKETVTAEVTEAANADIVETPKENSERKTPDVGADPAKSEAEMDNPKGEAEAAA